MENTDGSNPDNAMYKPCRTCGRTFNPESLERHEKICGKSKNGKHRQVFNSFQQRAKNLIATPIKPEKKVDVKKPKAMWKEQHDQLTKSPKNVGDSCLNNGCPSQKVIPLGYIQCPSCQRCFNHKAAERHIMWCQEQITRLPKSPPSSEALQRLQARVKYRAPLPRKRNSSLENQRLVKSAESCKPPSLKRTFSSPGISQRSGMKQVSFQEHPPTFKKASKSFSPYSSRDSNDNAFGFYNTVTSKNTNRTETPVVKFKEKFPNYSNPWKTTICSRQYDNDSPMSNSYNEGHNYKGCDSQEESDYDILNSLQLQLADLQTNDKFSMNTKEEESESNYYCLPTASRRDVSRSTLSLNEMDSGPLKRISSGLSWSAGQQDTVTRMPRFCYQCGTKYPVLEAKYCCECGSKRLVFGLGTDMSPVVLMSP